ncbi:MAG: hypothetical protein R2848_00885 [Thermomicrobiales bacterium]
MTFQRTTVTGTGRKIDDLMVRAYLAAGHALPEPGNPRPYPGGHTELVRSGVFGPIVKADVESLYPRSCCTTTSPQPPTRWELPPLVEPTKRRIDAKQRARQSTGEEHALWMDSRGASKCSSSIRSTATWGLAQACSTISMPPNG